MMSTSRETKGQGLTRREFIKKSAAGAAGTAAVLAGAQAAFGGTPALGNNASALAGSGFLSTARPSVAGALARRKRYAIVGTGGRHYMYHDAILGRFAETSELVGLCDINPGRLKLSQDRARAKNGRTIPTYIAADFNKMIAETKPDAVIVTTVDVFHHDYICRALELGCDAISEKPMTNQAEHCRHVLETTKKTGRRLRVTFNYRYSPPRTQVKDLLMSGVIGDIMSVDFHWMLNTSHGTDYFRRWHSQKKFSNGLMCHKATHHFDLVNWWLSAVPVSVFATGKREFYTPQTAHRFGLQGPHERCLTCPEKSACSFYLDLAASPDLKALYLDNEKYDGYFRDRCVFRPEIDIEDTMNVLVGYDNNVTLCYSVNAFNAWEGYVIAFNGTKGRLEHKAEESVYISNDGSVPGALKPEGTYIRIYPLREPGYSVDVWTGEGGHGGGDDVMLHDIFSANPKPDKYLRYADHRSGAYGCLIGIAANICFKTGQPVRIADLAGEVGYPDYPAMPKRTDPVPMPKRT
jgi:predicted dehydrogenase